MCLLRTWGLGQICLHSHRESAVLSLYLCHHTASSCSNLFPLYTIQLYAQQGNSSHCFHVGADHYMAKLPKKTAYNL